MYRRHLQRQKEMEDQRQVLTRVSNYPVVRDTWDKVSSVYRRGKESNRLLRFCGNVAESSASLAYRASRPVIDHLPVDKVNDYAGTKLDYLEKACPVIAKPTEEMVDAVKTYSAVKLNEARTYGTNQFDRFAEMTHLDAVIVVADTIVDNLLPTVKLGDSDQLSKVVHDTAVELPVTASTGIRLLSNKVKRRAYEHAMAKAGSFATRSVEAIAKLTHTVDLIDIAKRDIFDSRFGDVKAKVHQLYVEVTKEESKPLSEAENAEERAILVVQMLVKRVRSNAASVSELTLHLSDGTRAMLANASIYSERVYVSISNIAPYQLYLAPLLDLMYQLVEKWNPKFDVTPYIYQSPIIIWLASYLRDNIRVVACTTPAPAQRLADPDTLAASAVSASSAASATSGELAASTFNSGIPGDSYLNSTQETGDTASTHDDE